MFSTISSSIITRGIANAPRGIPRTTVVTRHLCQKLLNPPVSLPLSTTTRTIHGRSQMHLKTPLGAVNRLPHRRFTSQENTPPLTHTQHPSTPPVSSFPKFRSPSDFIKWYNSDPPVYTRYSFPWWASMTWLMIMFAATGSAALFTVRSTLLLFDIKASLFHGDIPHRILYFCLMLPTYSFYMLIFGRIFGRQAYSRKITSGMWGRWGKMGRWIMDRIKTSR